MRIVVAAIGRLKQGPETELAERYRKRAAQTGRNLGLRDVEIIEIRESRAADAGKRMLEESIALANIIPEGAAVVLLDAQGENLDSPSLSAQLTKWRSNDRPAAVCSTLGVWERIRVPNPAASTMPSGVSVIGIARLRGGLGRQDSNLGSGIQSPLPYRLATPQRTRPKDRGDGPRLAPSAARGLLAAKDQLRHAPAALASQLRVALAAELRLASLATAAAELGVAL